MERRSWSALWRVTVTSLLLLASVPLAASWGAVGHEVVASVAKALLTPAAEDGIARLLPAGQTIADNKVANWADHVRHYLPWSGCLHYVDTPDDQCGYTYLRDCHNFDGEADRCVSGALNNYTRQLAAQGSGSKGTLDLLRGELHARLPHYLAVEALKFVVHFYGDAHQPLHAGFLKDRGGNTIILHFFGRKHNLHEVWDTEMIRHALEQRYGGSQERMVTELLELLQGDWKEQAGQWAACGMDQPGCSDIVAQESIVDACKYAYADAYDGATLRDEYYDTRFPVVQRRLAQAGVRLAVELNRLFKSQERAQSVA